MLREPYRAALAAIAPPVVWFASGVLLLLAAGCRGESSVPQKKGSAAPNSSAARPEGTSASADDKNDKTPVRLSEGVAEPKSTPAGVAMSFRVDYKVTRGLNPSARYLFVIEGNGGKRSGQPTPLARGGTLEVLVHGWKPEDGPFEGRIDEVTRDGHRRPVSKSLSFP